MMPQAGGPGKVCASPPRGHRPGQGMAERPFRERCWDPSRMEEEEATALGGSPGASAKPSPCQTPGHPGSCSPQNPLP